MVAPNSVPDNSPPGFFKTAKADRLHPLSSRSSLQNVETSHLIAPDAMKTDRPSHPPGDSDNGTIDCDVRRQQKRRRTTPSISKAPHTRISRSHNVPNTTTAQGEVETFRNTNLQPLPSFSVLEDSIKTSLGQESQFLQWCGHKLPSLTSLKRRRVEMSEQLLPATKLNGTGQNNQSLRIRCQKGTETPDIEANLVTEESVVHNEKQKFHSGYPQDSLPNSSHTHPKSSVQHIINRVTDPAPRTCNEQAAVSAAEIDSMTLIAGPSVAQPPRELNNSQSAGYSNNVKAHQWSEPNHIQLSRTTLPPLYDQRYNFNERPQWRQNISTSGMYPPLPTQYHCPILTPYSQTWGNENGSIYGARGNESADQPQYVPPQTFQGTPAPTGPITTPFPHETNPAVRNSENVSGVVDSTRIYDLAKILRLGCKVVNGRVYNVHNLPMCAAPRENGNPCRRNVSRSPCKWHGEVIPLTTQNTKNGQLDASCNLFQPDSNQEVQTYPSDPNGDLVPCAETPAPQTMSTPQPHSRGLRWDNEEHFWFLLGYENLGKKWSKISRIIKTRNALQTQSHAQKHFERRKNTDKKKCTIHDLTLESPEMRTLAARIPMEVQKDRLSLGFG